MPLPYGFTAKGKIEYWIRQQKIGYRFRAATLHRDLFQFDVSRSTINSHLRDFAANGIITKSTVIVGRNQTWTVGGDADKIAVECCNCFSVTWEWPWILDDEEAKDKHRCDTCERERETRL